MVRRRSRSPEAVAAAEGQHAFNAASRQFDLGGADQGMGEECCDEDEEAIAARRLAIRARQLATEAVEAAGPGADEVRPPRVPHFLVVGWPHLRFSVQLERFGGLIVSRGQAVYFLMPCPLAAGLGGQLRVHNGRRQRVGSWPCTAKACICAKSGTGGAHSRLGVLPMSWCPCKQVPLSTHAM